MSSKTGATTSLDIAIVEWADREFGHKLETRDVEDLLKSRNGQLLSKLFGVLTTNVVSKKKGETMKEVVEAHKDQEKIKRLEKKLQMHKKVAVVKFDSSRVVSNDTVAYLTAILTTLRGMQRNNARPGGSSECAANLKAAINAVERLDFNCGGDDQEANTSSRQSSNDLLGEIESLVEDINGLLYEMLESSGDSKQGDSDSLVSSDLLPLPSHRCGVEPTTATGQSQQVHLNPTQQPVAVEQFKVKRAAQTSKLVAKLKQAKSLLEQMEKHMVKR